MMSADFKAQEAEMTHENEYGENRYGRGEESPYGRDHYGQDRDFAPRRGDYTRGESGYGQGRDRDRREWDPGNYGDGERGSQGGAGFGRSGDRYAGGGAFYGQSAGSGGMGFAAGESFWERQNTPAGNFRGKGPKGYVRSDERILEDVHERLSDDAMIDASNISVSVAGGEVTLDGFVDSRLTKRAAESCCEQCSGVSHVQNNLRIQQGGGQNNFGQQGSDQGGYAGSRGSAPEKLATGLETQTSKSGSTEI
jgi:osmotically-inducible protein OsmY